VSLASKLSIITSGYLSLFSFLNLKHSQKKKPTNTRPKMKCASILTSHINILSDNIVHKKIYFSIYKKVFAKKKQKNRDKNPDLLLYLKKLVVQSQPV